MKLFLWSIHDCFDFVLFFCFCLFCVLFSLLLSYVFADGELKFNYSFVEVKSCLTKKRLDKQKMQNLFLPVRVNYWLNSINLNVVVYFVASSKGEQKQCINFSITGFIFHIFKACQRFIVLSCVQIKGFNKYMGFFVHIIITFHLKCLSLLCRN